MEKKYSGFFLGAACVAICLFCFGLGWFSAQSNIAYSCNKLNSFYLGNITYECREKNERAK